MSIIAVPMRVDALVINEATEIVKLGADFAKLPYQDSNKIDRRTDIANLSSSISYQPFNNLSSLMPGVHLHWALPDALTCGESKDDGLHMPNVPNRWLIVRRNSSGKAVRSWVVESDYLYSADSAAPERAVCIPQLKAEERQAGSPPYRYMGRQLVLSQWQPEKNTKSDYYSDLNVLGWGNPYFSTLYDECFSVFGCYDKDVTSIEQAKGTSYDVVGWYSDSQQDYVQQYLQVELQQRQEKVTQAEAAIREATSQKQQAEQANQANDNEETREALEDAIEAVSLAEAAKQAAQDQADLTRVTADIADWTASNGIGDDTDRMLCFGRVDFASDATVNDGIDVSAVELALAPTGSEAIASYLSAKLTDPVDFEGLTTEERNAAEQERSAQQACIENQLMAVSLSDTVRGENVDFINRLKTVRHKKGFSQVDGGSLWAFIGTQDVKLADTTTVPESDQKAAENWVKETLERFKQAKADDLQQLNAWQEQANQLAVTVTGQRELLYADWTKYMLCLYPTDRLNDQAYPDSDQIKHFIQSKTMPMLDAMLVNQQQYQKRVETRRQQLEQDFQAHLAELTTQLDTVSVSLQKPVQEIFAVRKIPGPRYWQANEPSILITGNVAKASQRQGADGHLTCFIITDTITDLNTWVKSNDISTLALPWDKATHGWQSQPWNPLMMEWDINLYPDHETINPSSEVQDYSASFVRDNYRIPLNDDEFSLPSSAIDLKPRDNNFTTNASPTVIKGRSLLTPGIKDLVDKQLRDYLDKKLEEKQVSSFAEYKEQAGEKPFEDPIYSVGRAVENLEAMDCLSQRLTGLHDTYLMLSNGLRLPADDPSDFMDQMSDGSDQSFTAQIKARLSGNTFKLPSPLQRFTPIRSGVSKINQLRIIDSFGRFKDIDVTPALFRPQRQVLTEQPTVTGKQIYMPPRLVQPLRLHLRWHMLQSSERQGYTQPTPVCGWLVYNYFDETLVIHDTAGHYLGAINSEGEWQSEAGVNQPLEVIHNAHLRTLVEKLRSFHNDNRDDSQGENYLPKLKKAIRRAQDNIDPVASSFERAFMSSQPLAIVRASLNLQLQGLPQVDKSWQALDRDLYASGVYQRSCRQFTAVQFPIKLGEFRNLDDGLVCYWTQDQQGSLSALGSFPQSDMDDLPNWIDAANFNPDDHDYVDAIKAEGMANLTHSLDQQPLDLMMIVEPDAPVHATCGIVPKKRLLLEPSMYKDALEFIEQSHCAAPLLTPQQDQALPLPGGTWQWSQRSLNGDIQRWPSVSCVDKQQFIDKQGSEDEWNVLVEQEILRPDPNNAMQAYYFVPDKNPLPAERWEQLQIILQDSSSPSLTLIDQVDLLIEKPIVAVEGYFKKINLPEA